MSEPLQTSVENIGTGSAVSIRLVGTDKPLVTALAFAVALVAILLAYQAKTESRLSQYSYEQLREFMSQKGYPLPPDPFKPAGTK
jgi:hypothetical protein